VVHSTERLFFHCFQIELDFRSAGFSFCGGRKSEEHEEKASEQG